MDAGARDAAVRRQVAVRQEVLARQENPLFPNGSPFGDPGPHGDLFGDLGPHWVPILCFGSPFSSILD